MQLTGQGFGLLRKGQTSFRKLNWQHTHTNTRTLIQTDHTNRVWVGSRDEMVEALLNSRKKSITLLGKVTNWALEGGFGGGGC